MPGVGELVKFIIKKSAKTAKPFFEEYEYMKGFGYISKTPIPFIKRLEWIKHGDDVDPRVVEELITEAKDVESLKAINQYLAGHHFDADTTATLLGEAKEKAFKILWKLKGDAAFQEFIEHVGNPLALVESVVDWFV